MDEEEAKHWVKDKDNQNKVVRLFFEANKPTSTRIAFFMAGIPGAGKTEFTENTLKVTKEFISIEHDQLVEYIDDYKPEEYYNYRKAGSVLATRIFEDCLRNGYSFVFDGTLSHENGAKNIKKALDAGYEVIVVYIVQDVTLAWELTQARELVRKRAIGRTGFIETCKKINANLLTIFQNYKVSPKFSFWLIDKHGQRDMKKAKAIIHNKTLNSADEIVNALQKTYNIDTSE